MIDEEGNGVAAWTRSEASGGLDAIYARTISSADTLGPLLSLVPAGGTSVSLATDTAGGALALWTRETRAGRYTVQTRAVPAIGGPGPIQRLPQLSWAGPTPARSPPTPRATRSLRGASTRGDSRSPSGPDRAAGLGSRRARPRWPERPRLRRLARVLRRGARASRDRPGDGVPRLLRLRRWPEALFLDRGARQADNPAHVAFASPDRATVDAFHAAALAAGGRDNGEPGTRAITRILRRLRADPDGNNVEAVCHLPEG